MAARTIDDAILARIPVVLAECGGNISEAARRLGIDRGTAGKYAAGRIAAPTIDKPQFNMNLIRGLLGLPGDGSLSDSEIGRLIGELRHGPVRPSTATVAPPPAPEPPKPPTFVTGTLHQAPRAYGRIGWLSDLHYPYHDQRAVEAALSLLGDFRPDLMVLGGDLFDCHGISRYAKDPSRLGDTLQAEFDSARGLIAAVQALGCDVIYLLGNHEARIDALVVANPALASMRALGWHRMAELPTGWTVLADQCRLRVGHLDFLHGNLRGRGTGARHVAAGMLAKLKRSCLFGHYHRAQGFIEPDGDGTPLGAWATGHLGDPRKMGDYCPVNDWVQGFATVEYDHDADFFAVAPHLVIDGQVRLAGKTYRG